MPKYLNATLITSTFSGIWRSIEFFNSYATLVTS